MILVYIEFIPSVHYHNSSDRSHQSPCLRQDLWPQAPHCRICGLGMSNFAVRTGCCLFVVLNFLMLQQVSWLLCLAACCFLLGASMGTFMVGFKWEHWWLASLLSFPKRLTTNSLWAIETWLQFLTQTSPPKPVGLRHLSGRGIKDI